jgi:cell division septation protein DedD
LTVDSANGGMASSFVNSASVTEVVDTPQAASPTATTTATAAPAATEARPAPSHRCSRFPSIAWIP